LDRAISKLSFELGMGPFVHGRLQNLHTSKVTFAHVITPLRNAGCLSGQSSMVPFQIDRWLLRRERECMRDEKSHALLRNGLKSFESRKKRAKKT